MFFVLVIAKYKRKFLKHWSNELSPLISDSTARSLVQEAQAPLILLHQMSWKKLTWNTFLPDFLIIKFSEPESCSLIIKKKESTSSRSSLWIWGTNQPKRGERAKYRRSLYWELNTKKSRSNKREVFANHVTRSVEMIYELFFYFFGFWFSTRVTFIDDESLSPALNSPAS